MIGATPPSSMCRDARRRRCGFAPHSRESLIFPLRGANRLCAGADDWHKLDAFLCEESHMPRFSKPIHAF